MFFMDYIRLKHIAISEKNYLKLKNLGKMGDSFDDVLTVVLRSNGAVAAAARQEDYQA
jgi:predicted CopG family antitoxin